MEKEKSKYYLLRKVLTNRNPGMLDSHDYDETITVKSFDTLKEVKEKIKKDFLDEYAVIKGKEIISHNFTNYNRSI